MSGLFHRLAGQVLGRAPSRVHAVVRPAYAPAPDLVASDEATLAAPPAARPAENSVVASPTTPEMSRRSKASRAGAPQLGPLPADAEPGKAGRVDPPGPWDALNSPPSRERWVPRQLEGSEAGVPPPLAAGPEPAGKAVPFAGPASDVAVPIPIVIAPAAGPAPSVVERADRERSKAPARSDSLRTAPPTPTEAPAEVHVHIGRIEVTAIQEATPPKRKPRSGPQPMSLDEYLARRQRREA